MPKKPNLPMAEVKAALDKRIGSHDRSIFRNILTDSLVYKPRAKDWRKLREDPEKHARTVATLAKLNGFADRSESVNVTMDVNKLAETLINRYGPEKARKMLELHGLPTSLVPNIIDSTATQEA